MLDDMTGSPAITAIKVVLAAVIVSVVAGLVCAQAPESSEDPDTPLIDQSVKIEAVAEPDAGSSEQQASKQQSKKPHHDDPDTQPQQTAPSLEATDLQTLRSRAGRLLRAHAASNDPKRQRIEQQLQDLARQCQSLATQLNESTNRLEAATVVFQVYHGLAQTAQALDAKQEWMDKLRQLVAGFDQGDDQGDVLVEFWQLQADLFELNQQEAQPVERRRLAITRLERFLERPKPAQIGSEVAQAHWSMLRAVRLGLLGLYDEAGRSGPACELATVLRGELHRDDTTLRAHLDRSFAYCSLIGQRFDGQLVTDDRNVWTSEGRHGFWTLICFWAKWAPASVAMLEQLQSRYTDLVGRGVTILSVRVDPWEEDQDDEHEAWPWPTYTQCEGATDLAKIFRVYGLPRLVLIDKQSKVAAIGGSLDILNQIETPSSSSSSGSDIQAVKTPPDPVVAQTATNTNESKPDGSDQTETRVSEADQPQPSTDKAGQ